MNEQTINQLEDTLKSKFKPINPDDDFILRLKNRLGVSADIGLEPMSYSFLSWLIIFGLFSGLIIYWIITRLFHQKK